MRHKIAKLFLYSRISRRLYKEVKFVYVTDIYKGPPGAMS